MIKKEISGNKLVSEHCEIIDTKDIILDDESPLNAKMKQIAATR